MELVFEVLGRGHRQNNLYKTTNPEVTLGRGWNNDIILQDPLVESLHAKISVDVESGRLFLEDLGSVNGSWVIDGKRQKVDGRIPIDSGTEFILGRSRLRVFDLDHPVPETTTPTKTELLAARIGNFAVVLPVMIAALLIIPWLSYLDSFVPLRIQDAITTSVILAIVGIIWAAVWTFVGKHFKHEWHFGSQLFLAFVFLASMPILEHFNQLLTFNHLSYRGDQVGIALLTLVAATLLLNATLYLAIPADKTLRRISSFSITSLLVLVFVVMPIFDDNNTGRSSVAAKPPPIIPISRPEMFRLRSEVTIEEFISESDSLFESTLSQAESEE